MEFKQKVRSMRKCVRKLQAERDWLYEDMSMFRAPSECGIGIDRRFRRSVDAAFKTLGITEQEYYDQLAEYSHTEGQFRPMYDPPQAYYDILID